MTSSLTRRRLMQLAAASGSLLLANCVAADGPDSIPPASTGPTTEPSHPQPETVGAQQPAADTAVDDSIELAADLEVKIGQMFMVGFRGFRVDEDMPIVQDIMQRHLGGVVLFDYDVPNGEFERNIASPEQLQALTAALQATAQIPLLIAADQEGGVVVRLRERYGFPATLSAAALDELDNVDEIVAHAREMARTLAAVGINHNLAPVVDVNVNPDNPVIAAYERSFSADHQRVIADATAFIEAHHAENVLCTLKHFPGHGSSRDDSHRGFVDVSETWSRMELEPFAALIDAGLADSVMTAHIFNRRWSVADPATLAPAAINGLLRGELGYDGVVISDDMQMGAIREYYSFADAIRKALEAGVDIIAIANNSIYDDGVMADGVAVIKQLVADGVLAPERIDQSYQRIMRLKSRLTSRASSRAG